MGVRDTVKRNLLKHAAGSAMFCPIPSCGTVLDWRSSLLIDSPKHGLSILCGACWSRLPEETRDKVRAEEGLELIAGPRIDKVAEG